MQHVHEANAQHTPTHTLTHLPHALDYPRPPALLCLALLCFALLGLAWLCFAVLGFALLPLALALLCAFALSVRTRPSRSSRAPRASRASSGASPASACRTGTGGRACSPSSATRGCTSTRRTPTASDQVLTYKRDKIDAIDRRTPLRSVMFSCLRAPPLRHDRTVRSWGAP